MNILNGTSRVEASLNVKFEDLTKQQKDRANYLLPKFGESSASLVSLLDARGKNSWIKVDQKINYIDHASHDLQRYHDMLVDSFEVGKVYTPSEISGIVAETRRDLGLPAYFTRLQANCENDLFALFLTDDVYEEVAVDGKIVKTLVGYMPTFKLKTED